MVNDNRSHHEYNAISAGAILIALLFLFVWPGPLRYEYKYMPKPDVMVKIDKLNGHVWILEQGKWRMQ